MFDKHLISFDVDGNILISNRLNEKDRGLTNIKENDRIELNVQSRDIWNIIERFLNTWRNNIVNE